MRLKRPVLGSGRAPVNGRSAENASASTLRIHERGQAAVATLEPSSDQLFGSLESMFHEISFGESPEGQRLAPPAARYDDLWQLSLSDPLTGLANRMLLLDRLNRELARRQRHGGCVVVSHIDLHNLKDINDELGYTSGNEVLRGMSRRLTSMLRSEDTVSRVSESELVAVMTMEDEGSAGPLMRRIQDVLDRPIALTGRDVHLSASLGTVTTRNSESAEEVLARAGHAA